MGVDDAGDDRAAAEIDAARVALRRQVGADTGEASVPDPHLGHDASVRVHRVESAVDEMQVRDLRRSRGACLRTQPRRIQTECGSQGRTFKKASS